MKRAAPCLLFSALTLACIWPVVIGETLYDMKTLEDYLGLQSKDTPLLRANLAFHTVAVPEGAHRLPMQFRPSSARNRLLVAALSLVGLLAYTGRRKKAPS